VGNYPGVTVDRKTGNVQLTPTLETTILDLPGAYSMYPSSKDERIVVSQFLSEAQQPDLIIYVADVSQLEKQILLLTQLRDLGYPIVLALNMIDLPGVTVKTQILEEHFKIPVVPISGKTGMGITALKMQMTALLFAPDRPAEPYYKIPEKEVRLVNSFSDELLFPTSYGKLLSLHHAPWLQNLTPELKEEIKSKSLTEGFNPIQSQISETLTRYDKFTPVIRNALHLEEGGSGIKITDKIDRWVMHPILGSIIFFLIMLLIFQAIFAWASAPMDFIEAFMSDLSIGVRNVLPAGWLTDLISDGFLAGLTGILVFIPQIAILFLFIGILEEIGYMARAVSMFDVMMRKFGLNGRSIVALVSGGACAIQQS
jgi:ferrous iron transport protein B